MNFRKTSKQPLPPTLFSENYVALFSGGPKICNEIHLDWRDPPFSRKFIVFTPPKLPKKPQQNFLDRKWPPPFGSFPKIHPKCSTQASLRGAYDFLRSTQWWNPLYWLWMAFWGKILCMPRLLAKTPQKAILLQKPPIWGDLFLENHYGHNILQRKKALAIEALRVENVIMRTKLLKWSSFSPNFTQKVSFSPLPRTLLPHGMGT